MADMPKCPRCGSDVTLWTDLHNEAQADCTNDDCDWPGTFDGATL